MLVPQVTYWSTLINFIIKKYFLDSSATCILWNAAIDFELEPFKSTESYLSVVNINRLNLSASFENDIYNFTAKIQEQFIPNGLAYDELITKLTVAIEHTHCECFVAFQNDIPLFATAFYSASIYSIWRSMRTRFLFVYRKDIQSMSYFEGLLFKDQPNILVIEAASINATIFHLKTNKFVGSQLNNPQEMININIYNAVEHSFAHSGSLYPDKIKNLEGREIILAAFDYRPFVVFDYHKQPQVHDWAADNPRHSIYVDGTEVKVLSTFCELFNCSVQVDSSEKAEWGVIYPNASGNGLLGMIADRKSHIGACAMCTWYEDYMYLDMTAFLGRSGITCMVPAPKRINSWNLPLKPFQFTLWLGICACLIVEIISLLLTRRVEKTFAKEDNSWSSSFRFGYVTTFKLFISQSSGDVVNLTSVRVVLFSCYMIDIIITSIYGGGLASILTLPTLDEAADSLRRMHKYNLSWTAQSEIWVENIRSAEDPFLQELLGNFFISTSEAMREKAKECKMGFVLERMIFGHFGNTGFLTNESLDCMKLMIDDISYIYTVSFVQRLWPFLAKYNRLIIAWQSSGLAQHWEWMITAKSLNMHTQKRIQASQYGFSDTGPVKLDLNNFAGLILIWLLGVALSIVVFAVEIFYYNYTMQMRRLTKWRKATICRKKSTINKMELLEIEASCAK